MIEALLDNRKHDTKTPIVKEMDQSEEVNDQRFIRSACGPYLRARLGDASICYWYVDMGPYCQALEHWYIEDINGKVVLRAYCSPPKYLRSNPDGIVDLADSPHEWEEWTIVQNDNDTFSFLSHHGTWLYGRQNGVVACRMKTEQDEYYDDEEFTIGCF